jgi:glycosyltransferase involved in cell wall biosynthesis
MKLLFVGCYRGSSGWSVAARNAVLALDAAGVEVVPRCLFYGRENMSIHPRVRELEHRDPRGSEIVLQYALPYTYEWSGEFRKNIGYCFLETSHVRSSTWPRHFNLMDEMWLPCSHNQQACVESGFTGVSRVIPCATDLTQYERSYAPLGFKSQMQGDFVFYTIGEGIPRKNLTALVRAFHLEFAPSEPVQLVIKTSIRGLTPEPGRIQAMADMQRIRDGLNLYRNPALYKPEVVITEHLAEEAICRLHESGDCYVQTSYGEGWGVPCFEAMGFGKAVIAPASTAHVDYLDDSNAWLIPCHREPVTGMQHAHDDLYAASQDWYAIELDALRAAMRQAYSDPRLRRSKARLGIKRARDFSYARVGQLMKEALYS